MTDKKLRIVVCRGPTCGDRRGSRALFPAFQEALRRRGVEERVELAWQSCFGRCSQGPNVLVRVKPPETDRYRVALMPMGVGGAAALYNDVHLQDVERIVDEHVIGGRIVRDLILRPGAPVAPRGNSQK